MAIDFPEVDDLIRKCERGRIIPTELGIETVFGCNARCVMCHIDEKTTRRKRVMTMDLYRYIVDAMEQHRDVIDRFNLWSLGEPMLDPHIVERTALAKQRGFRNTAISTNADLLDEERQKGLLDAGIDTMIFSIDGARKETHESIRRGTSFERIVANCLNMIHLRDRHGYRTRFFVRMVTQDSNRDEWPAVREFWSRHLSPSRNDMIGYYPVHNAGGYFGDKTAILGDRQTDAMERRPCRYPFETIIILADGRLAKCPADFLEAMFDLGRVPELDPVSAFNTPAYQALREKHLAERKYEIPLCRNCTILYSMGSRVMLTE
ncbi:MAG: radical SAM protein [Alphaproteobacteria bacterium]